MKNASICVNFSLRAVIQSTMKKICLSILFFLFVCAGCSTKFSLVPYLSENRYAVYLGEAHGVKVQANAVTREYPYLADGLIGELSTVIEVSVTMDEKPDLPTISFTVDEKTYGGELSYDTVSGKYSYSCTLSPTADAIDFTVAGKTVTAIKMNKTDNTELILSKVAESESEYLTPMRSGKYFLGEVYLRTIYDDGIYYYVGIVDQSGTIYSLLTDEDGNVLARKK